MTEKNGNLKLWNEVGRTDPAATKGFTRGGGFKGTAISPMWLIRQATERWGPMGGKWGIRIIAERVELGAPLLRGSDVVGHASLHIVQAEVFYPTDDGQGTIPCFGQTEFVGQRKSGDIFQDEEAPKKSLTDALTKGLSWLGFGADVHMGLFDDVKYVNAIRQEFEEERKQEEAAVQAEEANTKKAAEARQKQVQDDARKTGLAILNVAVPQGIAALKLAWEALPDAMKAACKPIMEGPEGLKAKAAQADAKKEKVRA